MNEAAVKLPPAIPFPLILKFEFACWVVVFPMYEPLPAGKSAGVKALNVGAPADDPVAGPANTKFCVALAVPVPPCATVTKAAEVKIVALAFGNVNILSAVAGPVNLVNPFPVPPKVLAITPVNAAVPSKLFP